ncbi:hypothetical protein NOF04DRAFT_1322971 [Fusarium oxysporum II5]|nr:hypothetical protein NOF04DRAFT_1322971 [Fusarium oxysporum II5]
MKDKVLLGNDTVQYRMHRDLYTRELDILLLMFVIAPNCLLSLPLSVSPSVLWLVKPRHDEFPADYCQKVQIMATISAFRPIKYPVSIVPTSGRGPLILLAPPESLHSPLLLSSTREPTTPSVRSTGALSLWIAVARNATCCGAHYSTVTLQRDADCSSLRYWTLRYALYDGWIMPSPGILSGWALPMHAKHEASG